MINFRYHVVSLTAVFLALAVGLVLGSTVLNGPMLDAIESRVNTLSRDNGQLREQVSQLEEEADREQDFATEAAPMLLDSTLTARRVGMVVLPGGEEYVEGVAQALELAGATVTGEVRLTDKFTHPQHRQGELLDLADRALPTSVDGDALPANSDGVETSAALLAAVLVDGGAGEAAPGDGPDRSGETEPDETQQAVTSVPEDDRRSVLSAYAAAEYLEHDEDITQPAELVVIVAGLPDSENDADDRNRAMFTTVEQFALAGELTVAGSGVAGDGNVVAGVRGDPELADRVSTVDNAATPQGQITAGLAVARQLAGEVGHYGTGDGAESLLPESPVQ